MSCATYSSQSLLVQRWPKEKGCKEELTRVFIALGLDIHIAVLWRTWLQGLRATRKA